MLCARPSVSILILISEGLGNDDPRLFRCFVRATYGVWVRKSPKPRPVSAFRVLSG
jgi:hypothetical protein